MRALSSRQPLLVRNLETHIRSFRSPRVELHVHEVAVHVTPEQGSTHEVGNAELFHLIRRETAKTHS